MQEIPIVVLLAYRQLSADTPSLFVMSHWPSTTSRTLSYYPARLCSSRVNTAWPSTAIKMTWELLYICLLSPSSLLPDPTTAWPGIPSFPRNYYHYQLPVFFILLPKLYASKTMLSITVFSLLFASLSVVSGFNLIQSRQSVTPPPECDVISTWEVTNFFWFNSSDNLDCANPVNVRKCEILSPTHL